MNKKILSVQEYDLPIVVREEKEGGFVATCPKWKDCYAQGDSIEEAINEISYVASSLIELYKEEDMNIPLKLKRSRKDNNLTFIFPLIVST